MMTTTLISVKKMVLLIFIHQMLRSSLELAPQAAVVVLQNSSIYYGVSMIIRQLFACVRHHIAIIKMFLNIFLLRPS